MQKYIPPAPRFRSVKSVADTRLVKYLVKCRRFLRGFCGIYFSLSWLLEALVKNMRKGIGNGY